MKKLFCALVCAAMLAGCTAAPAQSTPPASLSAEDFEAKWADSGFARILLNDTMPAVTLPEGMDEGAVTIAADIIYYEEGHDESYGEGEPGEAHSAEEAAKHTVVHINAPGTYVLTGKLSLGQVAVDLGEDAKDDPSAVVTLILDEADITCTVAPAVIFYNVYESGQPGGPAGARVLLVKDTWNQITGSHTEEYDGALYSRMSMSIGGEGSLGIAADNEGVCSEMHLTVHSGYLCIDSGNDGINTNADGISVTTINGGTLRIRVTGQTGEGDGIDSNGSVVINGGTVESFACAASGDSGIDADLGIHLQGGTVLTTGNMLDRIEDFGQTYAVFQFAQPQAPGLYTLKNTTGETILELVAPNSFQYLLLAAPELVEGTYTLWSGDTQFQGSVSQNGMGGMGGMGGFFGDMQPIDRPDFPGGGEGQVEIPPQPTMPIDIQGSGQQPPRGDLPENMPVPDFSEGFAPGQMPSGPMPQGGENMPMPNMPGGVQPPEGSSQGQFIQTTVLSTDFPIQAGANYFGFVQKVE